MENIIRHSTNEGDVVLDPFRGSGATGKACVRLNRKFVGIDNNEKHYNLAKSGIELESMQKVMF